MRNWNGEGVSRSDIRLPAAQEDLLKAMIAIGKPTVVLAFHGRPLDLSFLENATPSVWACWTLGTEAGQFEIFIGAHAETMIKKTFQLK
jgi:beta-glucosidase